MAATMVTPAHERYMCDNELRPQHSRDGSRDSGIFHTTKGLWNAPGLNNCFLNSAVQVSFRNISSFIRNLEPVSKICCDFKLFCFTTKVATAKQILLTRGLTSVQFNLNNFSIMMKISTLEPDYLFKLNL